MFKLVAFALAALVAVATVNCAPIVARQTPPATYDSDILEPYQDYHLRYLAISCQNQHNTQFFDDCCHPLKKGETLENNRKPYCAPGANPSSTPSEPPSNTLLAEPSSSPAPQPTPAPGSDDDCEDDDNDNYDDGDDDCEDEPSTPTYEPSSTPPSVPTPSDSPNSTPTPTPTPNPEPSPSSTDDAAPSPTPTQNTPSGSETHSGGDLTWFTQNGVAGACGTVHSDSDFIAALDSRTYGDTGSQSSYCGKTIRISAGGKSVDVVVADACPTCSNPSSVDLSEAAFQALAPLDTGLITGASWTLL